MPRKFYESVGHALRGLLYSIRSQRNFNVHIFLGFCAVVLGFILKISFIEWAVLLLAITLVIIVELLNTAIEEVVNMLALMRKMRAKVAKDVSAAAVLIAAGTALCIGVFIFIPKIIGILSLFYGSR